LQEKSNETLNHFVLELISKKRRGSMRFSALGKIAGMGARSTINQRKKLEEEAAAAAAAKNKPMSRTSSRASMADSKGGNLVGSMWIKDKAFTI